MKKPENRPIDFTLGRRDLIWNLCCKKWRAWIKNPDKVKTHTKAKCENCHNIDILQLIEYKGIGICIFVCKDCYDLIKKRADKMSKRIKRFILRPRGGKK